MHYLIGATFFAAVIASTWYGSGVYLHYWHARWLRAQDRLWSGMSERERNSYRARGVPASWELDDEHLKAFVGRRHARYFRQHKEI